MIKKHDLFNEESICIFTDSSFKKQSNGNIAVGTTAPAYCVFKGDQCIEQGFHILHNSTSQQGELYALLLGVFAAYKYRNFKNIRIFADSQTSIFAIRDRIFTWVRDTKNGINVLGPEGRINNQDYIMDIVYLIMDNNIHIDFFHVKGHVDIKKYYSISEARQVFEKSNYLGSEIADDTLICHIAYGNNMVDAYSTTMLKTYIDSDQYNTTGKDKLMEFAYAPFDMKIYYDLVNKGGFNYD